MKKFSEIRKTIYQEKSVYAADDCGINLRNWKRNPYTSFKAVFYIETSAIFVFLLLKFKSKIHPNTITLAYAFCGIIGGVLLSIPHNTTIILALIIFFSKGILDWSDGTLARMTGRTSVEGGVLDPWGSIINSLGFQAGLGFYVALYSGNIIYFYLVAIILIFRAGDIRTCTYQRFATALINNPREDKAESKPKSDESALPSSQGSGKGLARFTNFIRNFLDDRARSVDFIILLIIIELLVPGFFVTWLVVWALAVKHLIIFLGSIFLAVKRGWIKNTRDSMYAK